MPCPTRTRPCFSTAGPAAARRILQNCCPPTATRMFMSSAGWWIGPAKPKAETPAGTHNLHVWFQKRKYLKCKISKALLLIEILLLSVIKLNIISSKSINKKRYIMSQSSFIKLKIENSGNQKIFSNITTYSSCKPLISPDEIYINGENQSEIKNIYNFENNNNEITLIWYNPLNNTSCMFKDCTSITEIDLSNFDDSQLIKMQYMFMNCQSLKKIEISNIHGNKVNDAGYLFRDCVNLESIDLANFKAPYNVYLHHMFENCKALASLNYPNFNTKNAKQSTNFFIIVVI